MFFSPHTVVGAISDLSISVIAAMVWDMNVCVLWKYISKVGINIALKKKAVFIQCERKAHEERLRRHSQLKTFFFLDCSHLLKDSPLMGLSPSVSWHNEFNQTHTG